MRIPKALVILAGVGGLVWGLALGIGQLIALPALVNAQTGTLVPFQTPEVGGALVNVGAGWFAAMGGLTLLFPAWMARHIVKLKHATTDEELIPKAYRDGGIRLIVGGALSLTAHLLFVRLEVVVSPLLVIAAGIVGLLSSFSRRH